MSTKKPECLLMLYKRLGFIEYPFIDTTIDLFSLCVLFSHFRSRDALMGIFLLFFCISYAYICRCIRRHLKETIPSSSITWSEMGKQNIQAKEVYFMGS